MTMDELRDHIWDAMASAATIEAKADAALAKVKELTGLTDEDLERLMSGGWRLSPKYVHRLPEAVTDAFDALGKAKP